MMKNKLTAPDALQRKRNVRKRRKNKPDIFLVHSQQDHSPNYLLSEPFSPHPQVQVHTKVKLFIATKVQIPQAQIFAETNMTGNATRAEEEDICSITAPTNTDNISVRGSLKSCFMFWKNTIKASNFVLSVIRTGYVLPFTSVPSKFWAKITLRV